MAERGGIRRFDVFAEYRKQDEKMGHGLCALDGEPRTDALFRTEIIERMGHVAISESTQPL